MQQGTIMDTEFSPRMWRWSWDAIKRITTDFVFSTYVEVILFLNGSVKLSFGFLHVCGGDPACKLVSFSLYLFSPRMWRWSYLNANKRESNSSFLHVCGGDPGVLVCPNWSDSFSPRMWRWFIPATIHVIGLVVFSTYVEVIPLHNHFHLYVFCFLHVCGGDPQTLEFWIMWL